MNLKKFAEMKEKYDQKVQEAEARKAETKKEFYSVQTQLKNAQYDFVDSADSGDKQRCSKLSQKLSGLRDQIKGLDEDIELIKEVRTSKLADAFPKIVEQLKKEHAQAKDNVKSELDELKKLRCETVLKALHLRNQFAKVNLKSSEIHGLARELGIEFKFRGEMESINLYNSYSGTDNPLAPSQKEVEEAYSTGSAEPFILAYGETGKLMTNAEASTYFRNKKEGDK